MAEAAFEQQQLAGLFSGVFLTPPSELAKKIEHIRAFVFDWDGVFNAGFKDEQGGSPFNEVDSMGSNLLRFVWYQAHGTPPPVAIISGERNPLARRFATREHVHALYGGFKNKTQALQHFCAEHKVEPAQICFFFDDILDLSLTKTCGLRMMIGRTANPAMNRYVTTHGCADYITHADGGHWGLREAMELIMALQGGFENALEERVRYTEKYQQYIWMRNSTQMQEFRIVENLIEPIQA